MTKLFRLFRQDPEALQTITNAAAQSSGGDRTSSPRWRRDRLPHREDQHNHHSGPASEVFSMRFVRNELHSLLNPGESKCIADP